MEEDEKPSVIVKAVRGYEDCEPGLYVSGELVAGPRFLTVADAVKEYGYMPDNHLKSILE